MQIKTTMRYHLIPVWMIIIQKKKKKKNQQEMSIGEDVNKRESLCTISGN